MEERFRTRYGLFEWLAMPFGLNRASTSFQRYVNETLREYLNKFSSAFLHDVFVYTDGNQTEYETYVRLVLDKLQKAGLGLKLTNTNSSSREQNTLASTYRPMDKFYRYRWIQKKGQSQNGKRQ